MTTILIVDKDLGFVFWLGQALDKAGYQALPAKTITDAMVLLGEMKMFVDLVIVSFGSIGALAFTQDLRRRQGQLEVIALLEESEQPDLAYADVCAWRHKPSVADEAAKSDWLRTIHRLFPVSAATGN